MTLEHLTIEIATSHQQRENARKHWLRWGLAGNIAGAILFAAVALEVTATGDNPSPVMIFIALTLSFAGVACATVGRLRASPRVG